MTTKIEYAIGDIVKSVDVDKWAIVVKIDYDGYWLKYLDTGHEYYCHFSYAHNYYKRARA